jgi:hypothetical protein
MKEPSQFNYLNFLIKCLVLLASILLISAPYSYSQKTNTGTGTISADINKGIHAFRFRLFYPAVKYEYGVTRNSSVTAGYILGGFAYGRFITLLQTEFRHYYNQKLRLDRLRNIENFNGNYLSMVFMYQFGSPYTERIGETETLEFQNVLKVGPAWGLQRNIKAFHFSFQVGGDYYYTVVTKEYGLGLILDVFIGFTICRIPSTQDVQQDYPRDNE